MQSEIKNLGHLVALLSPHFAPASLFLAPGSTSTGNRVTALSSIGFLAPIYNSGTKIAPIVSLSARGVTSPFLSRADLLTQVGWVSVRDFGAVGDGATNDAPAIQAAIAAALAAGGGVVFISAGTYALAAALTLGSNIYLMGAGREVTTLKATASMTGIVAGGAAAWNDLRISGIKFDANAQASTSCVQLQSNTSTRVRIFDNTFTNASGAWACILGLVTTTTATAKDWEFSNNLVTGNNTGTLESVLIVSWERGHVFANRFIGNTITIASCLGFYGYNNRVLVEGNTFAANSSDTYVQQGQFVSFVGNSFFSATNSGSANIQLINVTDISIVDNTFVGSPSGGLANNGVVIYDYSAATFDGVHTSRFLNSARIYIGQNRFDGAYACLSYPSQTQADKNQAITNVAFVGNDVTHQTSYAVYVNGAASTGLVGLMIANNRFLTSDSGFATITINGVASTAGINISSNVFRSAQPGIALAGAMTDVRILQNDLAAVATPLALSGGAAPSRIQGNAGINPKGAITVALPASGAVTTNGTGYDLTLYVTGGTVSAIAVSGVTTGATSGAFFVPAGATYTLTYTVAPTFAAVAN
ncbi:MAG: hypothetical protein NVS1B2_15760 [Vulcanimicrobiaceae bacterium]